MSLRVGDGLKILLTNAGSYTNRIIYITVFYHIISYYIILYYILYYIVSYMGK